jgi:hypothetical protein
VLWHILCLPVAHSLKVFLCRAMAHFVPCRAVAHKPKSIFVPWCGTFCAVLWHISLFVQKSLLDSLNRLKVFFSRLNEWKNFQSCSYKNRSRWCCTLILTLTYATVVCTTDLYISVSNYFSPRAVFIYNVSSSIDSVSSWPGASFQNRSYWDSIVLFWDSRVFEPIDTVSNDY